MRLKFGLALLFLSCLLSVSGCSSDKADDAIYGSWYSEEQMAFNLRLQRLHIQPKSLRIYSDSFEIVKSEREGDEFKLTFYDGHSRSFRLQDDALVLLVPGVGEITYSRVEPLSIHKNPTGADRLQGMGEHFKKKGG